MYKLVIAFLLFLFGIQATGAAERRCDGCTESDYQAVAIKAGLRVQYIYDFTNGNARKYYVEREPNELGKYDYFVDSLEVETEFQDAVSTHAVIYRDTGGTMQAVFEIDNPPSLSDRTAFDMVNPGAAQSQLVDYTQRYFAPVGPLPDGYHLVDAFRSVAVFAHSLIGAVKNIVKQNPLGTQVKITFKDGSSITMGYDAFDGVATIIENSARDAEGNPIPATVAEATSVRFEYPKTAAGNKSLDRMLRHLAQLGVAIVDGRNTGSGNHGTVCTGDGESGIVCTAY